MARRRRTSSFFFLICTYDYRVSPDEFAKSVETLIDKIDGDENLAGTPIHWHFPAILIERAPARVESRFRTRIASGVDIYLSMGYSGLPHPMLFPPEIALDIEWGALGGSESDGTSIISYPRFPDTLRKSVGAIYERGEGPMLINYGSYCELHLPNPRSPRSFDPISVYDVSNFDDLKPRRLVRAAAARDVAVAAPGAELERAVESGSLHRFLHELTRRGKRLARLTDLSNDTNRPSAPIVRSRKGRTGITLGFLDSLRYAPNRYRRDDIVQATRTVGGLNAAFWERRFSERTNLLLEGSPSRDLRQKRERILVSDMSGSVVLAGDRVCCQFEAGKLTEVRGDVPSVVIDEPSSTRIIARDRVEHFSVESAFSFDEPDMRGLQERLVCRSAAFREPIRVDLDTFFIDSAESLFMSIAIEFPEAVPGSEVCEVHPFALQLETDLVDPFLITRFLDGERNEIRPAESSGFECLWTAGLEIPTSNGSLHLFTPEGATVAVEHVLIRRLNRHRFELSLGGTNARENAVDLAGKRREWIWCLEILRPGRVGSSIIPKDAFDRLVQSYDLSVTSPA